MYKFLVVEDERHIREAVISILKEIDSENEIYGAENGVEALQLIEEVKPDAVITDIMMPMKNGIDLIKALYKRREKILVGILSGYDEFEYLQAALSYGAVDYILKPVKRSDIVKLYYKMVRRLKSRRTLENELAEARCRLDEIKPYIRQRCYSDLISGRLNRESFENICSFLGLHMRCAPIRLALIEIDENESGFADGSGEESLSLFALTEIMEGIISEYEDCDFFSLSNNTAAVIWCPADNVNDIKRLNTHLELLADELSELYKAVLNIGISDPVESPLEAGKAELSAREAIRYKLLYGAGQIFVSETLRNCDIEQEFQFDTSEIIESIWLNDVERAKNLITHFASRIRQSRGRYRLTSIQLLCQKLLIDCLIILEKECDDLDEWYRKRGNDILATNFQNYSVSDVEVFFHQLVTDICRQLGKTRKNDRKKAVDVAKQMIIRRYAEELTIEKIAKELHYSRNYFGQLFKTEMGMSVSEFINQVRVQKAKEMLFEGGYRIGQIAEKVGFNDQQYFTRVFKKIVGCMPSEYIP